MKKPLDLGLVGSLVPKKCGIATFGRDLMEGIRTQEPLTTFIGVAAEEGNESYDYNEQIAAILKKNDRKSYTQAANILNKLPLNTILLQHEFGLYGGHWSSFVHNGVQHHDPTGDYILDFLNAISAPVISTMHTVMPHPDPKRKDVIQSIGELSSKLVTMSRNAKRLLTTVYDVPAYKISVIPHGVPISPSATRTEALTRLKLPVDNCYLTVTGLIGPNKGVDLIIKALPSILENHPKVRLLVVGQTHPSILANNKEAYRQSLETLAEKLGVAHAIIFVNKYITTDELMNYLKGSDIYFTIHRDPEQAASGTLSYAVGTDIPTISTPYPHAKELLANERGILVPFEDYEAIAKHAIRLLDDRQLRLRMKRNMRLLGKKMSWPTVGRAYLKLARRVGAKHADPVLR